MHHAKTAVFRAWDIARMREIVVPASSPWILNHGYLAAVVIVVEKAWPSS